MRLTQNLVDYMLKCYKKWKKNTKTTTNMLTFNVGLTEITKDLCEASE